MVGYSEVLSFISKILEIIAWPLVVVFGFLFLKRYILPIVPKISNLKVGNVEINLDHELTKIETNPKKGEMIKQIIDLDEMKDISSSDFFITMANSLPQSAVCESWKNLEKVLGVLARKYNINDEHSLSVVRELNKSNILFGQDVNEFNNLYLTYNRIMERNSEISEDESKRFIYLIFRFVDLIKSKIR